MKRLVVCADGTWNEPGATKGGQPCPTNVVKLAQAVAPTGADGVVQVVFYHDGVGTHPGLDRVLGGMFGLGLDRIIGDLYRFLVQNFEAGDEIFLFGFSRGAFTVRSLAGMIRKCGILRKNRVDEVASAFAFYRGPDVPASDAARSFRAEKSVETRIRCIGVWDTVGALGIPATPLRYFSERKYRFHDVQLSSWVDNAFHALAIDERRAPFRPAIWEAQQPTPGQPPQTVKQVWFTGVHSDIGGGYASTALSDLTLEWMIREAAGCGLEFLSDVLAGLAGDPLGELHDSMTLGYRVLGDGTREIQLPTGPTPSYPAGFERLNPSVEVRYADSVLGYRPRPLVEYYEKAHELPTQEASRLRQRLPPPLFSPHANLGYPTREPLPEAPAGGAPRAARALEHPHAGEGWVPTPSRDPALGGEAGGAVRAPRGPGGGDGPARLSARVAAGHCAGEREPRPGRFRGRAGGAVAHPRRQGVRLPGGAARIVSFPARRATTRTSTPGNPDLGMPGRPADRWRIDGWEPGRGRARPAEHRRRILLPAGPIPH